MHSVPNDHGFAERQSRLGAVSLHEFVDCVPVAVLSVGAGKTIENRGFRYFGVGQSQDRFPGIALSLAVVLSLHDLWPPNATG
jgi:hypothetical protein